MKTNSVAGLVLDLRNNGGGLLRESISLTGLFIDSGPVVQVKERKQRISVRYDEDRSVAYAGPLLILVNRYTASASEILAGALQDYGRAVIVGDSQTHGKGTVQDLVALASMHKNPPRRNLGSLKVTNASFYRITGASTQRKGVVPDIIIPSAFDRDDIGEASLLYAIDCPPIERVRYEPATGLAELIPVLAKRSRERRANDPRFDARRQLLERFAQRREAEGISLNIEERRKLARAEEDLLATQNQDAEDGPMEPIEEDVTDDDSTDDKKKPDLILGEALQIVVDMIEQPAAEPGAAVPDPRQPAE
jgi:carboxyl-terminal processing protease